MPDRGQSLSRIGLLLCALTATSSGLAASASSSVTAIVLPARGEDEIISIMPRRIHLSRGRHSEFTVSNHSGETRTIHVQLDQFGDEACRLNFSPKASVLPDGGHQVFRLFYVTEGGAPCAETFRLQVHTGSASLDDSVYVDCY